MRITYIPNIYAQTSICLARDLHRFKGNLNKQIEEEEKQIEKDLIIFKGMKIAGN